MAGLASVFSKVLWCYLVFLVFLKPTSQTTRGVFAFLTPLTHQTPKHNMCVLLFWLQTLKQPFFGFPPVSFCLGYWSAFKRKGLCRRGLTHHSSTLRASSLFSQFRSQCQTLPIGQVLIRLLMKLAKCARTTPNSIPKQYPNAHLRLHPNCMP